MGLRYNPRSRISLVLGLAVITAGCRGSSPASGPSSAPPSPEPTLPSAPVQADRSAAPILPNPKLTPGAALPVTTDDICVPGYTQAIRDVPASVKRQVYEEYGITTHAPGEYEVDHLISLELGGSNSIRNLWPQSYRTQPWNAHVKDALENELHERVCSGQLDLKTAQREISGNWIEAYKKYFHTDHPLASRRPHRRRNAPEAAPVETTPQAASPSSPGSTPGGEAAGTAPGEVWVNTRSGKYFHPGSRYYGETKVGEYMSEEQARRSGYTPARGQ